MKAISLRRLVAYVNLIDANLGALATELEGVEEVEGLTKEQLALVKRNLDEASDCLYPVVGTLDEFNKR